MNCPRAIALPLVLLAAAAVTSLQPAPRANAETATAVMSNGRPENRVDIAFVGDGYRASEMQRYAADVTTVVTAMFAQEPFKEYKRYFNVHRVDVVSPQSGGDHPEFKPPRYVNTALDVSFNCLGIQRLLCANDAKVRAAVARSLAPARSDAVIVLVNDAVYGGAGGAFAVASRHKDAVELVLHELGHSFGLLADEYGGQPEFCVRREPMQVNASMVSDRTRVKWRHWLPSSGVGVYEGAGYCDKGIYRPTVDSKMRNLGRPYDAVNTEQLIRRVYAYVSPIDRVVPPPGPLTFVPGGSVAMSVAPLIPAGRSLAVEWKLDDAVVARTPNFTLQFGAIPPGPHTVSVSVRDTTPKVRSDPQQVLTESARWTFIATPQPLTIGPIADTWVSASRPTVGYGRTTTVKAKSAPVARGYLKFDVRGLSQPPTSAKLRLNAVDPSVRGGTIRRVADTTWTEAGMTYQRSPRVSARVLASSGPAAKGRTIEFDLTAAITGDGTYSFAIVSDSTDTVSYSSREGLRPPQLVLTTPDAEPEGADP